MRRIEGLLMASIAWVWKTSQFFHNVIVPLSFFALARKLTPTAVGLMILSASTIGRTQTPPPWPAGGSLAYSTDTDPNDPNRQTFTNWTWTDRDGATHTFAGSTRANPRYIFYVDQAPRLLGFTYTSLNATSSDGTYILSAKGSDGVVSVVGRAISQYVVLGVIYSPPGARSNVQFNKSQELGITRNTSKTWTNSINATASFEVGVIVASGSLSITGSWVNTHKDSVTTSLTTASGTGSTWNGASDGINHDNDVIIVWLNPQIKTTASNLQNPLTATVSQDFESNQAYGQAQIDSGDPVDINVMDLAFLTVGELRNPATMNPNGNGLKVRRVWAGAGEALTQADFNEILNYNPYWNPNNIPTPASFGNRYKWITTIPYLPNNTNSGYDTNKYSNTKSTTNSNTESIGVTWTAGAGISKFFAAGSKLSYQMSWGQEYTDTATDTKTVQTTFSVVGPVSTPTSPWLGPQSLNVYRDNLFGTYMFTYAMQ